MDLAIWLRQTAVRQWVHHGLRRLSSFVSFVFFCHQSVRNNAASVLFKTTAGNFRDALRNFDLSQRIWISDSVA